MENIIEMFHIDIKLIVAQIVNFGIVFFVLYKFVIIPLQKVMHERSKKIEKSLEDAKKISSKLENARVESENVLSKARRQANDILEQAKNDAEKKQEQAIEKAKLQISEVIVSEKKKMELEKENTISEIKTEIGSLIVSAVEKIIKQKVDITKDREMIRSIINENR